MVGNIGLVGPALIDQLVEDHRLVVAHGPKQAGLPAVLDERVRAYEAPSTSPDFGRLFDIYSFSMVVYISGYADAGTGMPDDQEELVNVANAVSDAYIDKFVYVTGLVTPDDVSAYEQSYATRGEHAVPSSGAALRAIQQEELCRHLLEPAEVTLVVLHVPFLAESLVEGGFLNNLFGRLAAGAPVKLPFAQTALLDLVTPHDLGSLLCHIVEEPDDQSASYEVGSGYRHTWGDFAHRLDRLGEGTGASCSCVDPTHARPVPTPTDYPVQLRKMYGWIPLDDAFDQLDGLYEQYCAHQEPARRRSVVQTARSLVQRFGFLRYVELLALFALVQAANSALGANIYYRFVDMRLLFVVLMGTMHGMRFGLLAAVLACLSVLVSYMQQGTDPVSILLRVESWLPFALYLLAGSITGYVSDKKTADILFAREEFQLLRNKYVFLNEVYTNAVENKGRYKHQILGFEDSFGRIFSVVQKLDDVMPQKLYLKSLEALEDILHSRSVALYAVDDYRRFGRLMACSGPLRGELSKSANLESWGDALGAVEHGRVWRNVELDSARPCYACGSFTDGNLRMIVCIWKAGADQFDMRFANLLKIMCGLLAMSFARAQEYASRARDEMCFPATDVMRPQAFAEVLAVQQEMGERGVADHAVLRFPGLEVEDAQARLMPIVRATDDVGVGPDGSVWALLRQANVESLGPVEARIAAAGLSFELAG